MFPPEVMLISVLIAGLFFGLAHFIGDIPAVCVFVSIVVTFIYFLFFHKKGGMKLLLPRNSFTKAWRHCERHNDFLTLFGPLFIFVIPMNIGILMMTLYSDLEKREIEMQAYYAELRSLSPTQRGALIQTMREDLSEYP